MEVMTLPISTTNMTVLRIMVRGWSFTNESIAARRTIFASQSERFCAVDITISSVSEALACLHQQVFENRSQRQRGEEGQRTHDQDHAHQKHCEQRRVHR